jgi:hypothetical protein
MTGLVTGARLHLMLLRRELAAAFEGPFQTTERALPHASMLALALRRCASWKFRGRPPRPAHACPLAFQAKAASCSVANRD